MNLRSKMFTNRFLGSNITRVGKRNIPLSSRFTRIVIRENSTAPRKSYHSIKTPLHRLYNTPQGLKYFAVLGSIAGSITQLNPNVLITLGPPTLIGSYFLNKYYKKRVHEKEAAKVETLPEDSIVRFKKYVESDVYNVLNDMDSQFDHFKRQVVDVVERRTVNYISESEDPILSSLFMDENGQFIINVSDKELESFIMLSVEDDDFIKISFPFYSGKDIKTRKRLGVFEVYMRGIAEEEDTVDYKMLIEISSYGFGGKNVGFAGVGGGITSSRILEATSKTKETYEDTI